VLPFNELKADEKYGIVICNPPYGERIGERQDLDQIYKDAKRFFRVNPSWSLYFLTSDKEFEKAFSDRPADKRRKLYNGRIETTYYQYYGERPPRVDI
jgi:putative N6-adenine-specific DNA methylase